VPSSCVTSPVTSHLDPDLFLPVVLPPACAVHPWIHSTTLHRDRGKPRRLGHAPNRYEVTGLSSIRAILRTGLAPHRRHQEAVLHERRNDAPPEAVGVAHARQSIKRHRRSRTAYQAQGRIQKLMEWHTASQDQKPQKSPCMISRGASPIAEGGGTEAPSTPDIATLTLPAKSRKRTLCSCRTARLAPRFG